jgi:membrane associated rhomboid family serine protease
MTPTSVGMRCPECSRERTKVKTVRTPSSAPSITLMLVAVNVVLFLGETATGTPLGGASGTSIGTLYEKGALIGSFIVGPYAHQYYRLVTSGFLHDGLLHILFNMWFLYIMGRILEPVVGRVNFVVIYFVSLLAGSFGALLFEPQSPTVGASGACFGILGALIVISHYRGISIWQSGLGLTLVINIVFSLSVAGISIGAHVGGVIGGAICGLLIVQLGERRRMPAAAVAGCVVLAVICVVGAIAVAGSQGLTPNGVTI